MPKITKTALMEEALKKYSPWKIEEAKRWKMVATFKDGLRIEDNFNLNSRSKKSKIEQIKTKIRSSLMNIKPNESNKRFFWDTSSENIESIKISLKFI